jgi:hypothetical protein
LTLTCAQSYLPISLGGGGIEAGKRKIRGNLNIRNDNYNMNIGLYESKGNMLVNGGKLWVSMVKGSIKCRISLDPENAILGEEIVVD